MSFISRHSSTSLGILALLCYCYLAFKGRASFKTQKESEVFTINDEKIPLPKTRLASANWDHVITLYPAENHNWGKGFSLSGLSATSLLIGDHGNKCSYIFTTSTSSDDWAQSTKLSPADTDGSFGWSVAGLSATSVAVGDPSLCAKAGAAYVFTTIGDGNWIQTARLAATDSCTYSQSHENFLEFGHSLSGLSATSLVVGAQGDGDSGDYPGAAYIFTAMRNSEHHDWAQSAKITAVDDGDVILFGASVAGLSATSLAVGAPGFRYVGCPGAVYMFTTSSGGSWAQSFKIFTDDDAANADNYFGDSLSRISATSLAVGVNADANYSGLAYIFTTATGGGHWSISTRLVAGDGDEGGGFGYSLSSLNESSLMVGAYSDDDLGEGSGAAYIFSATNGETNWTQSAKITPASGSAGDNFGRSVSGLSANTIASAADIEYFGGGGYSLPYVQVFSNKVVAAATSPPSAVVAQVRKMEGVRRLRARRMGHPVETTALKGGSR
mmetsp:Transcript_24034/g.41901  ORF Transcript_24034/g.41901 Transcript_24034/m.41901 type:complete len:498 (-) Transcript_24034:504-1997(-)